MMREDWEIVKLGGFAINEKGKKPANQKTDQDQVFKYPYINIAAFEKGIIETYTDGEKCRFCFEDDFLMVWDGSRSGLVGKGMNGALGSTIVRINFPGIENDYAYYFLSSKYQEINTRAKGSGTPHVDPYLLWNYDFSICSILEQRAIVAKIEELFSDLDKGMADLKKAQDQLKIYRQAVLKKEFEGEFNQVKVIEIADVNTGATPKRGNVKYWENGNIPWVTSGVVNKPFVNEPSEHITDTAIKETNCKIIEKGSLLVAMYGEGKTRGKCCELNIDAATNQALAAITLKKETQYSKEFVKWFFVKNYEEIRLLSSGGVQPNLNLTLIKNTILPFPSKEVQHQIVQEIESRLSVCDKVEESISESLEKAKALRQSILKKAFEGRLLSVDEIAACKAAKDYEPASVLLEKIKAEKKK
tara:strand:+ start:1211 stop:2458 length:1248 start_codon:yes stop_codon:yes gene_type:complete